MSKRSRREEGDTAKLVRRAQRNSLDNSRNQCCPKRIRVHYVQTKIMEVGAWADSWGPSYLVRGLAMGPINQRDKKIGIRLTLGATAPSLLQLVLKDGVRIAIAGLSAGLAVAAA